MSAEMDASVTLILWLALTFVLIAVACFIGDWYVNKRRRNRYTRKNERYFRTHGTRIIGRNHEA